MDPPWTQSPQKLNANTFITNNYYSWYCSNFVTIDNIFAMVNFFFLLLTFLHRIGFFVEDVKLKTCVSTIIDNKSDVKKINEHV